MRKQVNYHPINSI